MCWFLSQRWTANNEAITFDSFQYACSLLQQVSWYKGGFLILRWALPYLYTEGVRKAYSDGAISETLFHP